VRNATNILAEYVCTHRTRRLHIVAPSCVVRIRVCSRVLLQHVQRLDLDDLQLLVLDLASAPRAIEHIDSPSR